MTRMAKACAVLGCIHVLNGVFLLVATVFWFRLPVWLAGATVPLPWQAGAGFITMGLALYGAKLKLDELIEAEADK